jgi:hypothetical protein
MQSDIETVTLWRPVGPKELELRDHERAMPGFVPAIHAMQSAPTNSISSRGAA